MPRISLLPYTSPVLRQISSFFPDPSFLMGWTDGTNEKCKPSSGTVMKISSLFLILKALALGPQPFKIPHTIPFSLAHPQTPCPPYFCDLQSLDQCRAWGIGGNGKRSSSELIKGNLAQRGKKWRKLLNVLSALFLRSRDALFHEWSRIVTISPSILLH